MNSKMSEDWIIAKALLNKLEQYALVHHQSKNIQYSIYKDKEEYKIKIEKDEENILRSFLEGIDE